MVGGGAGDCLCASAFHLILSSSSDILKLFFSLETKLNFYVNAVFSRFTMNKYLISWIQLLLDCNFVKISKEACLLMDY